MTTCFTEEEISRYLDGESPPGEARLVRSHVRDCPKCGALYRKLRAAGLALEVYSRTAVPPDRKRGPSCFHEGTLAAYADGSLGAGGERQKISAHVAGCDRCSRIVVEAARGADLARSARSKKPEPVPERLSRMIEERYFPPRPVSLGRVDIELRDVLDIFTRWLRPGLPGQLAYSAPLPFDRFPMVAEDMQLFDSDMRVESPPPEEEAPEDAVGRKRKAVVRKAKDRAGEKGRLGSPRQRAHAIRREAAPCPKWSFERGEIQVSIEVAGGGGEEAGCRINIKDRNGRILSGISLVMEKDGKQVWSHSTQLKQESVFPHLTPGRYSLIITHDRAYRIDLDVR